MTDHRQTEDRRTEEDHIMEGQTKEHRDEARDAQHDAHDDAQHDAHDDAQHDAQHDAHDDRTDDGRTGDGRTAGLAGRSQ
jgi:hypothetical protein